MHSQCTSYRSSCSYNSVLFGCFTTGDYVVALVRPSLKATNGTCPLVYQLTIPWPITSLPSESVGSFLKVSNSECLQGYSSPHISQWGNVLLVTDSDTDNPVFNADTERQ